MNSLGERRLRDYFCRLMITQDTANLWHALCKDLETGRQSPEVTQHIAAADAFVTAARDMFKTRSPRLCEALEIAGDVHHSGGDYAIARERFEEALSLAVTLPDSEVRARLSAKLGVVCELGGERRAAFHHYETAITHYRHAGDRSQTSTLYNNMAGLAFQEGDFKSAKGLYSEALEESLKRGGENNPEAAVLCQNLGITLEMLRDYGAAENYLMQSMSIRERMYGATHPEVARSLHCLGSLAHAKGEDERARQFYHASLATFRRFVPDDDPEVKAVLDDLAGLDG